MKNKTPRKKPKMALRYRSKPPANPLGAVIFQLRTAKGWPIRELSRRSKVEFSTISLIETEPEINLRLDTFSKLAAAFGLTPAQLMEKHEAAKADQQP